MNGRKDLPRESADHPLQGLKAYLESHQKQTVFERVQGSQTPWCLFLHGGREVVGQIQQNEPFEIHFLARDGSLEKIHKVQVHFLCAEPDREEVGRQLKHDEATAARKQGPHFLPRFRNHVKNKTLFPLMNRREVLFFTLLGGEVLRGVVSGFSRYEIELNLKRGTPVVVLRHAVADVRDKKARCFLKKEVEKSRKYW